jgi:hypothetical protein
METHCRTETTVPTFRISGLSRYFYARGWWSPSHYCSRRNTCPSTQIPGRPDQAGTINCCNGTRIGLILIGVFRLRSSWTLLAVGILLLPYLTLSGGPAGFVSMSRFNLVSFPLFVVLADVGLRAHWLMVGVIGLFSGALFLNAALFARHFWIG